MDQDTDNKTHDPTEKRLNDAREKGEIPRSQDVLTAAAFVGFLLALLAFGTGAITKAAEAGMTLLARPDGANVSGGIIAMLMALLPLFLIPALPVLGLLVVQRGLLFTPSNLVPKLSRIDPLASAQHRFGPDGLMEFAKATAKMVLIAALLALFLRVEATAILTSPMLDPRQGSALMMDILLRFLMIIVALALVLGAADYLWQVHRHRVRNRMSRQELLDEHRDAEGDPHTRAARRQRGQEIAMNRMLADVPTADVVVVNPTHYAVALKWHRTKRQAPICVAKGVDETAARIRDLALEHGIALHRDPPTARALFATVGLGEEIRPDHYRSVAAAIRFADAMRKRKAKGQPRKAQAHDPR